MKWLDKFLKWIRNLSFGEPKTKSYLDKYGRNDPLFVEKYVTSESWNRVSENIRENKREIYNLASFYFVVFLTLSVGVISPIKNLVGWLILGIVLMFIFMFKTIAFHKRRFELAEKKREIVKVAKSLGILREHMK